MVTLFCSIECKYFNYPFAYCSTGQRMSESSFETMLSWMFFFKLWKLHPQPCCSPSASILCFWKIGWEIGMEFAKKPYSACSLSPLYIGIYVCVCMCVYLTIYAYTYVYMYIYISLYICVYIVRNGADVT